MYQPRPDLKLSDEEQEIIDHIVAAMRGINNLGLQANQGELVAAVHALQMFPLIHAMHRLGVEGVGNGWFRERPEHPDG